MRKLLFTLTFLAALYAHADGADCNALLSQGLNEFLSLEQQTAQKSVLLTNKLLRGKDNGWAFWRGRRNPWIQHQGQRILVVSPADSVHHEATLSYQTVLSLDAFSKMVPDIQGQMNDIISLSRTTGNEWGFVVYVLKDSDGQPHLVTPVDNFTSNSPTHIRLFDTMSAMEQAVEIAKNKIQRDGRADRWEVTEMWLAHTHPNLYSPLSAGDIKTGMDIFINYFKGSLRFRMIAVTTEDPTVFSALHEADFGLRKYWINKESGWTISTP